LRTLVSQKLAVSIVAVPVEQKMLTHGRDLLVLFRAGIFCPNGFLFNVHGLVSDREKLKSMCDNLGAVYSSDVDD